MPTLQAANLNHFEPAVEAQVQFVPGASETDASANSAKASRINRLRGYFALGTLLIVSISGYAAIFVLFDRFIAFGSHAGG